MSEIDHSISDKEVERRLHNLKMEFIFRWDDMHAPSWSKENLERDLNRKWIFQRHLKVDDPRVQAKLKEWEAQENIKLNYMNRYLMVVVPFEEYNIMMKEAYAKIRARQEAEERFELRLKHINQNRFSYYTLLGLVGGVAIGLVIYLVLLFPPNTDIPIYYAIIAGALWGILVGVINNGFVFLGIPYTAEKEDIEPDVIPGILCGINYVVIGCIIAFHIMALDVDLSAGGLLFIITTPMIVALLWAIAAYYLLKVM